MTPTVLLEYTKEKSKKSSQDISFTMIGKAQKFSSGFVPDYRHAVETVGESEVFVSSGRVDSEGSSAPKRKCISFNVDRCDGYNVPKQVISISKMSISEREELEMRLRSELEQIQMLQKKIRLKAANGVAVSSTTDVQGKKCPPTGQNTPQLKHGHSGRFAPPPAVSNTDAMLLKRCETVLKILMQHQYAWVFNTPVDVVKLKIADYLTIIKHPMDLGTINSKIVSGAYVSPWEFVSDVRLTFTNAKTYNPPGNDVHIMADIMSKFFEIRWKSIEKRLHPTDSNVVREVEAAKPVERPKKRKASLVNHTAVEPVNIDCVKISVGSVKKKITVKEKQNLSSRLESLLSELPKHIIDFLRQSGNANQTSEDEIEIDIDNLSDATLFELQKLLDGYLQEKGTEQEVKAEPGGMEILKESDLIISSMQPCRDSNSASSSRSESDVKVSTSLNAVKETVGAEAAFDQEKSDIMNPVDGNRSAGGSDQLELNAYPKAVSVEVDGHQEGESAPSERQISPEKLYRAALLRSRFADTILKAREKTLDQGEKGDPEKLRRKRQELERKHREEKARLQAEAEAAEAARRQAEAEAAAEAKSKRELAREAARQALLKMEKSVEINESSQFLKDLDMLRTAPDEQHLPSSVDETSPDHSKDGTDGFKLGGSSNPLEQLGLFIKVEDEEEEEEVEPDDPLVDDVEEGEID